MKLRKIVALGVFLAAAVPAGAAPPVPLVTLTQVAALSHPLAMATRPGDARLFIAEKGGRVRALDGATVTTVLEIAGEVGDVGQNQWEEIDYRPATSSGGENYGWNQMEGAHPYAGGTEPAGHVPPLYEYPRVGTNCSVTGGYVYRGTRIPALQGAYLFADFCTARLNALVTVGGLLTVPLDLGVSASLIASFGEDASGELYVLSTGGPIWRVDPAA
ncbi:MAG TPA: hypothetical protein VGB52_14060 [Actinomycetota bacterium]